MTLKEQFTKYRKEKSQVRWQWFRIGSLSAILVLSALIFVACYRKDWTMLLTIGVGLFLLDVLLFILHSTSDWGPIRDANSFKARMGIDRKEDILSKSPEEWCELEHRLLLRASDATASDALLRPAGNTPLDSATLLCAAKDPYE